MVARPSLKRVVPGSVPPWRALCAESARALKAFFSVLCVSNSALLLESKFGQILRALNLRAFWVRPSCTRVDAGAAGPVASRSRVHGWSRARFLLRARVFRGPVVVSGCRNVSRGRAVVFHFRQSRRRGSLSSSLRLIRCSLSTFAVETLLAWRGAELPSWRGVAAKRELEIIAEPLGLLHAALLSGRSFLRAETRTNFCACNVLLAACQFVLFAARRFLQFVTYFVGRAAQVALVWKLTLGSGPGWVGLRSKLLIDVAMKISMSQIL